MAARIPSMREMQGRPGPELLSETEEESVFPDDEVSELLGCSFPTLTSSAVRSGFPLPSLSLATGTNV